MNKHKLTSFFTGDAPVLEETIFFTPFYLSLLLFWWAVWSNSTWSTAGRSDHNLNLRGKINVLSFLIPYFMAAPVTWPPKQSFARWRRGPWVLQGSKGLTSIIATAHFEKMWRDWESNYQQQSRFKPPKIPAEVWTTHFEKVCRRWDSWKTWISLKGGLLPNTNS